LKFNPFIAIFGGLACQLWR